MRHFGSTPAVDGLVVVAHDAQVLVFADQCFDEVELNAVGVLVFVNLNLLEHVLVFAKHLGELVEQSVCEQ